MSQRKDTVLELQNIAERKLPRVSDVLAATSEAEFEAAFDVVLGHVIQNMEFDKNDYCECKEGALNSTVKQGLNALGYIRVTRETNANGHADFVIQFDGLPERTIIGE